MHAGLSRPGARVAPFLFRRERACLDPKMTSANENKDETRADTIFTESTCVSLRSARGSLEQSVVLAIDLSKFETSPIESVGRF